ncbi:MAG TPA: hypothetical protein VE961_19135 [Pyrinomonadaceae bacterium]|nr:hypothetical protein [Pyrinomonadaceae bacterium]
MQNMSPGKSALGLDANVVAGLCYIPVCYINLILSIITVVTDKTNKLARFHAFQSIFLSVGLIVVMVLYFCAGIVGAILDNAIGYPVFSLVLTLLSLVLGLAILIAIVIAAIKGFQGQIFKLPVIGNLADKYSG